MMNDPDTTTPEQEQDDGRPDDGTRPEPSPEPAASEFTLLVDDRTKPDYGETERRRIPAKLELATPRITEMAKTALELRMADLSALAKKNLAEGYPAAARTQTIDAAVIKNELLPQLQRQLDLENAIALDPFHPVLLGAFERLVEPKIRDHFHAARNGKKDSPGEESVETTRMIARLLADVVADFAFELFVGAYEAGLSERRGTFERIASRAAARIG